MKRAFLFVFLLFAPALVLAPDWASLEKETMRHFQATLRLDTSHSPGNETLVVDYLKALLDREVARNL